QVGFFRLGLGEVGHDYWQDRVGPDPFVNEVATGMAIGQNEPTVFGFVHIEGIEEAQFLNTAGQSIFLSLWMCPPVPRRAVDLAGGHSTEFLYAVSDRSHDADHSWVLIVPLEFALELLSPNTAVRMRARSALVISEHSAQTRMQWWVQSSKRLIGVSEQNLAERLPVSQES